jgi:hypothetical protein
VNCSPLSGRSPFSGILEHIFLVILFVALLMIQVARAEPAKREDQRTLLRTISQLATWMPVLAPDHARGFDSDARVYVSSQQGKDPDEAPGKSRPGVRGKRIRNQRETKRHESHASEEAREY